MLILLTSIFAGLFIGITESINKKITEEKYSVFAYSFLQVFFNMIIFGFFCVSNFVFPPISAAYIYVIILSVFIVLGNVFLIKAYKTEDLSIISIISRLSLVVAFIMGVILLGESATYLKLFGVLFILLGSVVLFYKKKHLVLNKGMLFTVLSAIFFGSTAYFQKKMFETFSIFQGLFLIQLLMTVFLFSIDSARRDYKAILKKYYKSIIVSRLFAVIGIFLISWSVKNGPISIVNTNYETVYLIYSVVAGMIIFKERRNTKRVSIGLILCLLGIIFLNLFTASLL